MAYKMSCLVKWAVLYIQFHAQFTDYNITLISQWLSLLVEENGNYNPQKSDLTEHALHHHACSTLPYC